MTHKFTTIPMLNEDRIRRNQNGDEFTAIVKESLKGDLKYYEERRYMLLRELDVLDLPSFSKQFLTYSLLITECTVKAEYIRKKLGIKQPTKDNPPPTLPRYTIRLLNDEPPEADLIERDDKFGAWILTPELLKLLEINPTLTAKEIIELIKK